LEFGSPPVERGPGPVRERAPLRAANIPEEDTPTRFVGRRELLDEIAEALGRASAEGEVVVLRGQMGVGKSRAAMEYGRREFDSGRYDLVWWMASEQTAATQQEFAGLAAVFALPQVQDLDRTRQAVLAKLEQADRWLLVFDNVDDIDRVVDYLPASRTGHILLTSRMWTPAGARIRTRFLDVVPLPGPDAVDVLRPDRTAGEDLRDLAEELDRLPLALVLARTSLSAGVTAGELLGEIRARASDDPGGATVSPGPGILAPWTAAVGRLRRRNPVALDLLHVCAFLGAEMVPDWLLRSPAAERALPPALARACVAGLPELVRSIGDSGLAEVYVDGLVVHRLTGRQLRATLPEDSRRRYDEAAESLLLHAFPADTADSAGWPDCRRLLKTALSVGRAAAAGQRPSLRKAVLLNRVGNYLFGQAAYRESVAVYQRCHEFVRSLSGPARAEAAAAANLGLSWLRLGQVREAQEWLERAHALRSEAPNDQRELAASYNNLGCALREAGRLTDAAVQLATARLLVRTEGDSVDHAVVLNNLGVVQAQRRAADALALLKEAVARQRRLSPARGELLATMLNNLSVALTAADRLTEAEAALRDAQRLVGELWPDSHPDVAGILNNLGVVSRRLGRLAESRRLLDQALEIDESFLGPDHPETAATLSNLGVTFRHMGRYVSALFAQSEALRLYERAYGTNDRRVAAGHGGLGNVLRRLGGLEEAVGHHRAALEIEQLNYPAGDFEMAGTHDNLGRALRHLGRLDEAIGHFDAALEIKRAQRPIDPVDVAKTEDNLGIAYRFKGEHRRAAEHHRRAADLRRDAGGDARGLHYSLVNGALAERAAGRMTEAEDALREAALLEESR
jgi:tetratricopeptide (TPR) repeat protein